MSNQPEQDQTADTEITEGNSFQVNKALAALCADEEDSYPLSHAAVLPNPDPEQVYLVGCNGQVLGIATGEGHCVKPFLISRRTLAGKVGRLFVDTSGQVTFPFVGENSPPPYPDVMSVLPKRPDQDAIAVTLNPDNLARLLKLFDGHESVTLFVHDSKSQLVLSGEGTLGVIMALRTDGEQNAVNYKVLRARLEKHLPMLMKRDDGKRPEQVRLEPGETVDTETGEATES